MRGVYDNGLYDAITVVGNQIFRFILSSSPILTHMT